MNVDNNTITSVTNYCKKKQKKNRTNAVKYESIEVKQKIIIVGRGLCGFEDVSKRGWPEIHRVRFAVSPDKQIRHRLLIVNTCELSAGRQLTNTQTFHTSTGEISRTHFATLKTTLPGRGIVFISHWFP